MTTSNETTKISQTPNKLTKKDRFLKLDNSITDGKKARRYPKNYFLTNG